MVNQSRETVLAENTAVARTFLRSLIGLMGRKTLAAGEGLWIVPCQSVHTFWMRFPIDVLFLDADRSVIYSVENMKPFRVSRHIARARSVLELPAQTIRATQTQVGDRIKISTKGSDW